MANQPNRLISEQSPYLLQHAYNPVDWYPWGAEAFDKAKSFDRPILLSIGYATCHWCHVMAHESFEDPAIAEIINANFIPIKVDREERPDLDHIYMSATTAMSGQGGWPMTVFLTAQAKPFYGGTYFPPYAKWGAPGFADLLLNIAEGWNNNRSAILSSADSIVEALHLRSQQMPGDAALLLEDYLHRGYRHLMGQFDSINGGFGGAPKFPMGHNLSFLLRYYQWAKEPKALAMVEAVLTAMAQGGICDHLGGGFHRYATDGQWRVPHFEKMLYDQALLLRAYVEAYQLTGYLFYAQVAEDIANYVLRDLQSPQGGFYSAEDADSLAAGASHASEGAFYIFSEAEINRVLGIKEALVFNCCYGIKPNGNAIQDPHGEFVGQNILYAACSIKEAALQLSLDEDEVFDLLAGAKAKLLSLRNERQRPFLDDKVLVDWNGLMISSLAFAGCALNKPEYTRAAQKAADFILDKMMPEGVLLHRWRNGQAGIAATLEDYAFFAYALLELYKAVVNDKYLNAAEALTVEMRRLFEDVQGGFFMTPSSGEQLILRPKEAYDGAIPSGNAVALHNLLQLYALTGKQDYHLLAKALMDSFKGAVEHNAGAHTFMLSAMAFDLVGATEILLEGNSLNDEDIAKMLKVVYKGFMPYMALRFRRADSLKAYVCHRGVCRLPVGGAEDLAVSLLA